MDDILLNKANTIERCIQRIKEEYIDFNAFKENITVQDSIILNLQRAVETAIDMGTRVVRVKNLGIPQNSRNIFELLAKNLIISEELSKRMQKMVGFRNIAIHDYTSLNLEIIKTILEKNLSDILEFSSIILKSV